MKKLNERYAEIVRARFEENVKSGNAAVEFMRNSTAIYRGEPVACLYLPKIFSRDAYEFLREAARQICEILDKVIARYLHDSNYRALFPFSRELEELILSEAGYSRLLPIARLDIFFNEDDFSFQFCEFNADGASAMNEDREINNAIRVSDAFHEMCKEYDLQSFEFFDSWVREFAEIFSEYNAKKFPCETNAPRAENSDCSALSSESHANENCDAKKFPRVAIVDFMENATPNEFLQFQKAFEKAGFEAVIAEIRDLKFSNGELQTPDGKKIDAVYRRAVTCDIMRNKADIQPFLQAARENAACIIGHFRTQIIHNKSVFKILRAPETFEFLTRNEQEFLLRHIPETFSLTREIISQKNILKNKNEWIIKPEDLYGSRGVFAGVDHDDDAWEKAVNDCADSNYLLQKFCTPYKTENLDFNGSARPNFIFYNNITGLFVYNGKFSGIYSRAGLTGTISTYKRGLTLASMLGVPSTSATRNQK